MQINGALFVILYFLTLYNANEKTMFRFILSFTLLFGILIGCSNAQENEIQDLLLMQQFAWNEGNIDSFMQGYLMSDSLRFVGSGGEVRGWHSTLERYKRNYPTPEAMGTLQFDLHEIRLLGQNHAMIYGSYTLQRTDSQSNGLFTLIALDTSSGWRIIHDHTSAVELP